MHFHASAHVGSGLHVWSMKPGHAADTSSLWMGRESFVVVRAGVEVDVELPAVHAFSRHAPISSAAGVGGMMETVRWMHSLPSSHVFMDVDMHSQMSLHTLSSLHVLSTNPGQDLSISCSVIGRELSFVVVVVVDAELDDVVPASQACVKQSPSFSRAGSTPTFAASARQSPPSWHVCILLSIHAHAESHRVVSFLQAATTAGHSDSSALGVSGGDGAADVELVLVVEDDVLVLVDDVEPVESPSPAHPCRL